MLNGAMASADGAAVPLTSSVLERLDPSVEVPTYDRHGLARSIVHVGVGGFHRAHLATFVHELCQGGNREWSIVGSGVRAGDAAIAEALGAQDHLYTLITRGASTTRVEVIGSIVEYLPAWTSPERLIAAIAAPSTQIVSLTVTEGGYPVDDVTGSFAAGHAAAGAGSAFSILTAGLARRHRVSGAPITIMSCDNIMANGDASRTATLGLAAAGGPALVRWIESAVAFPNSMVDRITPATTDADRSWLAERVGLVDRCPVVTEPFRQWVLQDAFAGARLPVEGPDVIVTTDVEPYEQMKLRLLNAGHSCLAYLAALLEIVTVDEAMADHDLRRFVVGFLANEAKPVVPPVAGIDLDAYSATLVDRFSNPLIGDQIARLCLDGSAKFPKFLLPTIRAQLARGGPVGLSALALAGWCEYLNGVTESGAPIAHAPDPRLESGIRHARASQSDPRAFLRWTDVFGSDLAGSRRFSDVFAAAVDALRSQGTRSAIEIALHALDRPGDGSQG